MKARIYSHSKLIGISELQITDETMGVVSGVFIPNENYHDIRPKLWEFHHSISEDKFSILNQLRLNAQLENHVFLNPLGGCMLYDLEELPKEDLLFEAAGNYRHSIEDNFLSIPPRERILDPWESISIDQKIAFEDELHKEVGTDIQKPNKHKLSEFKFSALATNGGNDDVLFSVNKKGVDEYDYAVVHLTWKGGLEENDTFPQAEFFTDFNHFLNDRLQPDILDWDN